ncbi:MAG TPA: hypothetical protein VFM68_02305 [Candidatus Saccharimonadales bacterium]|nr:hypothetical protein [Candidatus Saccharimonadales bacterium]
MRKSNLLLTIIAIIVAVVVIIWLVIWAVGNTQNQATPANTDTNGSSAVENEQESTLSRITSGPDAFVGQDVTVTGEVQDVLAPRIFKISNDTAGDELTVLTPQPLTVEQAQESEEFLQDNANVLIVGTIQTATVAEIERDYGLTLDAEVEAEFDQTIVLVAHSITFTDQTDDVWLFDAQPEVRSEEGL